MKNKLKLSWSKISAWSRGDKDGLYKMLAGLETEVTPAMEHGRRVHKKIASLPFTKQQALLPNIITETSEFEDFRPEDGVFKNYLKVELNDWLVFSMVADVIDPKERFILDWKTGSRNSNEHNKLQVYVYAMIAMMANKGLNIEHGYIAKVRETTEGAVIVENYSDYIITPEKLELAANYIQSNAQEIYNWINQEPQRI
jgi:hypothetical protein